METKVIASNESLYIREMKDSDEDYKLISKWLTDPDVLQYYYGRDNPYDLEKVRKKYSRRVLGKTRVKPCIFLIRNEPIGYLQYYPLTQKDKKSYQLEGKKGKIYAIDLFIGEKQYWNQGIGPQILILCIGYLINTLHVDYIVIDPHVDNLRAIRAYEKAGFKKVKMLPKHELHEGKYKDSWLMVYQSS